MAKCAIKDFWWFHNVDCWRIKRQGLVDTYFFVPTGKYIYKGNSNKWYGKKTYLTSLQMSEKDRKKTKLFKSETQAVRWLAK
jgi:hypothetical protein